MSSKVTSIQGILIDRPIHIGISACLLGEKVRFDGGQGEVPLVVPLTLIKHYVRRFNVTYLADQVYLNPHPKELALRSHV